jgi:hypothetical protein
MVGQPLGKRASLPIGRVALGFVLTVVWAAAIAGLPSSRAVAEPLWGLWVNPASFSPAGSGTISTRDGLVNCVVTSGSRGGICYGAYIDGSSVIVDVSSSTDSDACEVLVGCQRAFTLSLTMTAGVTISDYGFKKARAHIEVRPAGPGAGSVAGTGGISCPEGCAVYVPLGTEILLTATPASGSAFGGWDNDGPCNGGSAATCMFLANDDWVIYPTFVLAPTPSPAPASTPTVKPISTPQSTRVETPVATPMSSTGHTPAPIATLPGGDPRTGAPAGSDGPPTGQGDPSQSPAASSNPDPSAHGSDNGDSDGRLATLPPVASAESSPDARMLAILLLVVLGTLLLVIGTAIGRRSRRVGTKDSVVG